MSKYSGPLVKTTEYKSILSYFTSGMNAVSVTGLSEGARVHFAASLREDTGKNMLYVVPTETEAKQLAEDFRFFAGDTCEVVYFPKKDYVFYNVEAMNQDVLYDRISALQKLVNGEKPVVAVACAEAAVQYTVPKELMKSIEF